jgi:hypothetical protein
MRHFRYGVPILGAVLLMLPASASASTQWFYNQERTPIAEGQVVAVPASGPKLQVSLKVPHHTLVQVACPPTGELAFWNTPLGGQDEVRAISFACPKRTTIIPMDLPWSSSLLESEIPLHDWWNVAVDVIHNGVNYGVFSGSLDSLVGDVDPLSEREKEVGKDDPDSYATYTGGKGKVLIGPNGATFWLSDGGLRFGGKGNRVTDESGWWGATP